MIRKLDRNDLLLLAIAAGKLLLNVAFHGRYGWFRDELYYLACSHHLAWGYVDQPPLSIAVLALTRTLAGESIWAVRFPAALAGAATVVLTGLIARRLGGGRFAQLTSALAVALSGVVLGNAGRFFSMNAFDLMFWAAASYVLVALLEQERPRLWLAFGTIAGLGLLNKYSMLFLGFGVVVGLVLTSQRRQLASRWLWLGGLIAAAIVLPHVLWEVGNGWPSIEFMRNATQEKNVALSPLAFFRGQVMMFGIAQAPLWLAGIAWFAFHRDGQRLRLLAWLYPVVFATMVANGAKAYYLTPIYFPYLAAGAVWLERVTSAAGARRLLRPAAVAALLALGAISLPFAIPALPVERFVVYARALGQEPKAEERNALAELPQYYADMFGWEELAEGVGRIARERLSAEEREHAVVYVRNYGEAAALDRFGPAAGAPPVLCGHNSYWFWGPERLASNPQVAIVLGAFRSEEENLADLQAPGRFGRCELAGETACRWCMPYENGRQWFVCRDPEFRFAEIWDGERHFI